MDIKKTHNALINIQQQPAKTYVNEWLKMENSKWKTVI